jgi:nucleotide-binding universal stress UspA family protein
MDIPVIEFKKILYAADLSESGRYAFNYAASLSHKYDAELSVIHVVEEDPELFKNLSSYMSEELWGEIKNSNLQEAREILFARKRDNAAIKDCVGQYCNEIQPASSGEPYVTYQIIVKAGNPVEGIIDEAAEGNFDLIVMGRHGHGTLKDSMMGETARRVLRRANIPTLLVPLPENE